MKILFALPFFLTACVAEAPPFPMSETGYRSADDTCRLAHESDITANYLDHTTDLVACPVGADVPATFQPVKTVQGFTLYSVPRG